LDQGIELNSNRLANSNVSHFIQKKLGLLSSGKPDISLQAASATLCKLHATVRSSIQ